MDSGSTAPCLGCNGTTGLPPGLQKHPGRSWREGTAGPGHSQNEPLSPPGLQGSSAASSSTMEYCGDCVPCVAKKLNKQIEKEWAMN